MLGFLYGVKPTDTLTFAIAAAVLCMVAVLANVVPARHAASIDPTSALRVD
jgi:ABC-type antimicrobial peptide transport system permease subunit